MATWFPRLDETAGGPRPVRGLAWRIASGVVALVAAIVLLVPLVAMLRPASSSTVIRDYEHGARPTPSRFADGGFSAAFPSTPTRAAHRGAFDGTPVTGATYESDPDTGFRFVVTYLDLPAAAAGREADVVDAAMASTANSFGGSSGKSAMTIVDGHPRGEFTVMLHDASFRGRVIAVGTRVYVYGVQTPRGHDASFTRFVDSFTLDAD